MRNYSTNALVTLLALMFILSVTRLANAAGPLINLPSGTVNARYNYPGANSYWDITLANVPSGCDVTNAIYVGWCCDQTFTINNGATLGVKLYSSYDPGDPYTHSVDPGDWNRVNYILNNKLGTADDQQAAIWYFIDGGVMPTTQAGKDMVSDAIANGGSFLPAHGQLLAVVLYLAGSQTTFIEVTVPTVQLTVTSAYDTPTPTSGPYTPGTSITASVTSPVAGSAGTQYVCTGWTGTGSVVSGTGTSVTFTITQDSSITWNWKTQYYLTVKVDPSGLTPISGQGWYDAGAKPTLTAPQFMTTPFLYWDIDGVSKGNTVNPITVTMNAAYTATAHYYVPGVGGEWAPVQTAQTMVPYLLLSFALAGALTAGSLRLLKKRW